MVLFQLKGEVVAAVICRSGRGLRLLVCRLLERRLFAAGLESRRNILLGAPGLVSALLIRGLGRLLPSSLLFAFLILAAAQQLKIVQHDFSGIFLCAL